ncbi:hypothetical protein IW15_03170 [Chryseobacterium soli]|uniref:Uncharacterized protein n=1 Tax=Chryseobacterium soli TaxID=445961 RepID=A0A086ACN4_9FLAO|nr:hypothetical protein [Chryseobacterium soli]KFF14448.1 hypothetical protein IW15_03170 [Chryseobacterium soli]
MKTKTLEKLENFQLQNKKLDVILGGQGAPVKSFLAIDPVTTGGGEYEFLGPKGYECHAFTSDLDFGNGGMGYNGVTVVDKPVNN